MLWTDRILRSILVLAGAAKKVLGGADDHPPCPYRKKPIKCPGRLSELLDEDGRHRTHHSGYMPDMRNQRPDKYSIRQDTDKDEVIHAEAYCLYCLAHFWGKTLKSVSDMFEGKPGLLPQDVSTWMNTREISVMKKPKFCPRLFPYEQIKRAEEQARR